MVAEITERTYTLAEFMALPDDGHRYELMDGRIVQMAGPGRIHSTITTKLARFLDAYVQQNALGEVHTGGAFVFDPANHPNSARILDVAFVAVARLVGLDKYTVIPFAPDFAVEVVSPSDEWYRVLGKVAEYRNAGVRLVWVISPPDEIVLVYHPDSPKPTLYGIEDELSGEGVIPGFTVRVAALFEMGG